MNSLGFGALFLSALLHSGTPTLAGAPSVNAPATKGDASAASNVEASESSIPVLKRLSIPRTTERVKLTVVPPADAQVRSGDPVDPSVHGFARVEGTTQQGVQITYRDIDLGPSMCATDPIERELRRVWTATDALGNTGTCTQAITVLRRSASLDVRPGVCPNEYKVATGGTLAISVVGRPDFDVRQIDTNTIELWTANCSDGPITPSQFKVEDDSTPYTLDDGGCHAAKKDGRLDLTLRFTSQQLANDLHLKSYPKNALVKLIVTGKLATGATFVAVDSVRLK